MNYRHAFHAGNFADCVKHALMHRLLEALARKNTPFRVLDLHAGAGRYDLRAEEPGRTGEWRRGIGRLEAVTDGPLEPWLRVVRRTGWPHVYPGSPALAQAMLRPQDRLVLCELQPAEHTLLRQRFADNRRIFTHEQDGWAAATGLTPFPERRGLLLLDPPFEQEGDFERLAATVTAVSRRFRGCVQAAWYPVKHRAPVRAFHDALRESGVSNVIACELWLREPTDPTRLNGCGVVIVNPPWMIPEGDFAAGAEGILSALLASLGDGEPGQGCAVTRLVAE